MAAIQSPNAVSGDLALWDRIFSSPTKAEIEFNQVEGIRPGTHTLADQYRDYKPDLPVESHIPSRMKSYKPGGLVQFRQRLQQGVMNFVAGLSGDSYSKDIEPEIQFSKDRRTARIELPRFIYQYQGVRNPIVVSLDVQADAPIQPDKLAKESKKFLESKSAEDQWGFWERLNESLVVHLMDAHPELQRTSNSLRVDSTEGVPSIRTSTVTYERTDDGQLNREEFFSYLMPSHYLPAFPGKPLTFRVIYRYTDDFQGPIENFMTVHDRIAGALSQATSPAEFQKALKALPDAVKSEFKFLDAVTISVSGARGYFVEGEEALEDYQKRLLTV